MGYAILSLKQARRGTTSTLSRAVKGALVLDSETFPEIVEYVDQ